MSRRTLLLPALFALAAPALAQSRFASSNVQLRQQLPPEMFASTPVGDKSASDVLHITVSLPLKDRFGAEAMATALSDPGSPDYRKFLTPEEVGSRFGYTETDISQVADYLKSNGMTVKLLSKNHLTVMADGTVAQAEAAFHTTIRRFSMATVKPDASAATPEEFFSYTTPLYVPSDVAPFVLNVSGLDNYTRPIHKYVSPTQIRTLYNTAPLYTGLNHGEGRTVAISSFDGYRLSNLSTYYTQWALPAPAGGVGSNVTVKTVGTAAGPGTPKGEGDLDIQAILGVAPLCNLVIYDSTTDLVGVLTQESNDNLADIVSESYGWSGSSTFYSACHNLHVSLSLQGITYMAASGDSGTNIHTYPYPDFDPEVLMVGGTTVSVTSGGSRVSETGWSGSGGGWHITSDSYNKLPSWQKGTGVPTSVNFRLIPDVALDADPNSGYMVRMTDGWHQIGGTSGASPTFAGSLATVEQYAIGKGALPANGTGKRRMGRIQGLLYSYNGDSSIFFDVTSGANGTLPDNTTSTAKTGWDYVTGWGAVNFKALADKTSSIVKVTSLSATPNSVEGGASTSITVKVNVDAPAGASGQVVSLVGSDPSLAVPASVTIPAGQTSTSFLVAVNAVTQQKSVQITGSVDTSSASTTVTVTPPKATALALSPTSVRGGGTSVVTGTVTLDQSAPSGGVVVSLTSSNTTAATVPATITVAAGQTTGTFTVTHKAVAVQTAVTISASSGGQSQSATLTVQTAALSKVSFAPTSVYGGIEATGTVTLTSPAPAGGVVVTLSESSPYASLAAASVTVPAGSSTATFAVSTIAVNANQSVAISGTLGAVTKTGTLTVKVANLASINAQAGSLFGGDGTTPVTVTLGSPAGPSGAVVTLTSSNAGAAHFPSASVTVPAGQTAATVTLSTSLVTADVKVTLTGAYHVSKTDSLTVRAIKVIGVKFNQSTFVGSGPTLVTGTVTLNAPAPTGGAMVSLSSSASSIFNVPTTVVVPAGVKSVTFSTSHFGVGAQTVVTVTASYNASAQSASVTVNP